MVLVQAWILYQPKMKNDFRKLLLLVDFGKLLNHHLFLLFLLWYGLN